MPSLEEMGRRVEEVQAEIERRWTMWQTIANVGPQVIQDFYDWFISEGGTTQQWEQWRNHLDNKGVVVSFLQCDAIIHLNGAIECIGESPLPGETTVDNELYAGLPRLGTSARDFFFNCALLALRENLGEYLTSTNLEGS